jgi:signal transduction histidine kinase
LSLLTAFAIAAAANNLGPFIGRSSAANIFTLQLFLLGIGVPLFCMGTLVQERQQAQDDLEESEERYRSVVTSLPHAAVLLFGPGLRHLFADGQGLPEMDLTTEAIKGKSLWESFPAPMAAVLQPHYQAALTGRHDSFDVAYAGRTYQAETLPATVVNSATGMLLLQDVTDSRRVEALIATNAELNRLNEAKSEFVSVISHEFRTPLTGIQAFSELLRDEEFSDTETKEFAGFINQEAERLGRMIGDLLDLDRMESGRMMLQLEALDFNALVEGVVAAARPNSPGHTVQLDLDPGLPTLTADRDKLTQVVVNLLSNAIKYSPDGGAVTVGTALDAGQAHLAVRDEGIGIADAELEVIFERYTRLLAGQSRSIEGTGLGLAIVRQIAELHGGRAWAESTVGKGSTFHVLLPLGTAVNAA